MFRESSILTPPDIVHSIASRASGRTTGIVDIYLSILIYITYAHIMHKVAEWHISMQRMHTYPKQAAIYSQTMDGFSSPEKKRERSIYSMGMYAVRISVRDIYSKGNP